ncbi:hypothetical protein PVAG01_10156 [Phlyctema vagabunda]|uniref:Uncharacterized protein n=1 Tax=Phlyctema vagabunda TaxID=108571 RepID=A0ABR4P559_9HELO
MSHHTGRRPPRRGEGRPQENDDPNRNLRSHRNSGRARAGRRDGGESQPTPGREAIREETQGVHADLTLRQYQQYRYYHDLERAANAAVSQAAVAAHEDPAPEEEEQDAAHGDGYEAEAPLNAPPPSTTAYDVLYEENFNMFAQLDAERCECNKHPYPHVPETGICDNTPMVRIHGRPAAVWRNRQAWLRWLELHPFLMDEYLDALDEYERLYSEEDGDGDEDEDEDEDSEEEREEEDEDQYRPVNERARLLL